EDPGSNATAASQQAIEIPVVHLLNAAPQPLLLPEPAPPSMAGRIAPGKEFQIGSAAQSFGARGSVQQAPSSAGAVALPRNSAAGPGPKLGDLTDYKAVAERTMRFATPTREVKGATAITPKQTLPGPSIPRELTSLQAAGLTPVSLTRPRKIVVG